MRVAVLEGAKAEGGIRVVRVDAHFGHLDGDRHRRTRPGEVRIKFTTAGFYTSGTMIVKDGRTTSHEYVTGGASGVSEVKATGEVRSDGTLVTRSEHLKDGQWVTGHSATYREDAKAQVVFK